MSNQEIIDYTKQFSGMRHKYNKHGELIVYVNVFTFISDLYKKIFKSKK